MTTILSGPMFEPAKSEIWESLHKKSGAHYNNFACRDEHGMAGLRQMFPDGKANEFNLVLFSTSGIHGTYFTIEEAEAAIARGNKDENGEEWEPSVTFLIVHPRICCLRNGNCRPKDMEDIEFLKRLRDSSWREVQNIGKGA